MPIPTDGRLLWTGTHAAIPANWSRDANFDGRYIQGGSSGYTSPSNDGGTSHDHTMVAHTHTGSSHTHDTSATSSTEYPPATDLELTSVLPTEAWTVERYHTHDTRACFSSTMPYTSDGGAVTLASEASVPPSIKAIIIGPDDGNQDIPDDASCFTDETSVPTGFATQAALDDRFILGADAPNGGGGGTLGAATHTHISTPNHTHAIATHTHSGVAGTASTLNAYNWISGPQPKTPNRLFMHPLTLNADGDETSTGATPDSDAVTNDPAYVRLLGIQNTSGGATTPDGVVILFVGDVSAIPSGWALMDGTGGTVDCLDKQIKCTTDTGEIGDTGGNDEHAHMLAHTHSPQSSHDHAITQTTSYGITFKRKTGSTQTAQDSNHLHISWSCTSTLPGASDNTNATTSSVDIRRNYRTAVFIKRVAEEEEEGQPAVFFGCNV